MDLPTKMDPWSFLSGGAWIHPAMLWNGVSKKNSHEDAKSWEEFDVWCLKIQFQNLKAPIPNGGISGNAMG